MTDEQKNAWRNRIAEAIFVRQIAVLGVEFRRGGGGGVGSTDVARYAISDAEDFLSAVEERDREGNKSELD